MKVSDKTIISINGKLNVAHTQVPSTGIKLQRKAGS